MLAVAAPRRSVSAFLVALEAAKGQYLKFVIDRGALLTELFIDVTDEVWSAARQMLSENATAKRQAPRAGRRNSRKDWKIWSPCFGRSKRQESFR
jgi:hypothetical protein